LYRRENQTSIICFVDSKKSPRGYWGRPCGSLGELDTTGNTGGRRAGTTDQRRKHNAGQSRENYSVEKWFAVKHGSKAFRLKIENQGP
jgi:hypothetical protein